MRKWLVLLELNRLNYIPVLRLAQPLHLFLHILLQFPWIAHWLHNLRLQLLPLPRLLFFALNSLLDLLLLRLGFWLRMQTLLVCILPVLSLLLGLTMAKCEEGNEGVSEFAERFEEAEVKLLALLNIEPVLWPMAQR